MIRAAGASLRLAGWLLAGLAVTACTAAPATPEPLARFPRSEVVVETGGARHAFAVWVADTPARRAQGLMFVQRLGASQGMLFLFDPPEYASFWMLNTYIPLDLLFVGADGRVVNIAARAVPHSTEPMLSTAPVTAVLEVPGGTADRLGIRPGDRVLHAALGGSSLQSTD